MKERNKKSISLIKYYQKNISQKLPGSCKYNPTCSSYAIECYKKYNFLRATFRTWKHICFCNLFAIGGKYD